VWVDAAERDTAALLALSGAGGRAGALSYLAAVLDDESAARRRQSLWRSARDPEPGAWDGLLGTDARAALAARHPFDAEMHPTRLERYVSCPFAFLLRDVLELDAPDEPGESLEMEPRDFGTLAHDILQRAFEQLIAAWPEAGSGLDVAVARAAVESAWRDCCAEAEANGLTGAPLAWTVTREMLREDLLETVARDAIFRGDGRPVEVEWRFGEAAGLPVALALPGGRQVRFAGRVDRVDVTVAGARVIDYKTGKGTSERERLKAGLSVQLPAYQLAVRQAGDAGYGEIASLYQLVTRKGGFEPLPLAETEPDAAARLARLVAGAVALVDAGMFPRSTAGRCEYCDVGYACGTSAWARARMRGHEKLSDVVALQAGRLEEGDDDA
jgi:RecB family exonuclease